MNASVLAVMRYFGFSFPDSNFSVQWARLAQQDKDQIRSGLGDGTLTY